MEKGQGRRREPITIGIMGTGAVGGYFGAMLARAGHRVVFVARPETAQVIVSTGLRLERSDTLEVFMPPRISASSSPQDLRQVDAVLLCVKATATEEAAALMRGVLRRNLGDEPAKRRRQRRAGAGGSRASRDSCSSLRGVRHA